MKSKKEIEKQAREVCPRKDTECAVFVSGYVLGYRAAEKEYENGQNREKDI